MNTASNYSKKPDKSSKKKDETKVHLGQYFLGNQKILPQELISAWGGLERLELEARTIETEGF